MKNINLFKKWNPKNKQQMKNLKKFSGNQVPAQIMIMIMSK
jgi:hypothetical protein